MSRLTINNSSVITITITNQTIHIDNITCVSVGGGSNSNHCTGNKPFNISALTGITNGYIKMIVDAGTGDIVLQKKIGGALVLNEVIPITENLKATFAGLCSNPSEGYRPCITQSTYTFQYSQNGINGWTNFNLIIG